MYKVICDCASVCYRDGDCIHSRPHQRRNTCNMRKYATSCPFKDIGKCKPINLGATGEEVVGEVFIIEKTNLTFSFD